MEIINYNGKEIYIHPVFSDYGCDKNGCVYSMKHGKIRKMKTYHRTSKSNDEYRCIWVYKNGKRTFLYQHRFDCECFMGHKIIPNCEVHHIDKNPKNNSKSNLLMVDVETHKKIHGKVGY